MPGQVRTTAESVIERDSCEWIAKELGVHSVKFNTTGSDTGYPDRIFWIPGGQPLLIEFKKPGGQLSAKQKYQIERLEKLGYNVKVCTNARQAFKAAQEALGAARLSKGSS